MTPSNALKDVYQSIKHCKQSVRQNPDNAAAHLELGIHLYDIGQILPAIAHWRKSLASDPNQSDAHYFLGLSQTEQDNLPAAVEHYRQAISINPNDSRAYIGCVAALQEQGKNQEAIAQWRTIFENFPDLYARYYPYFLKLHSQEQLAELEAAYAQSSHQGEVPYRDRCSRAAVLYRLDQASRSISLLSDTIEEYPNEYWAYNLLGTMWLELGKPQEAEAVLTEAVNRHPQNAILQNNLAIAYQAQRQWAKARQYYANAIELDETLGVVYFNLGLRLLSRFRLRVAGLFFNRAVRLLPTFAPAHMYAGMLREKPLNIRTLKRSTIKYHQALRLDPSLTLARFQLSRVRFVWLIIRGIPLLLGGLLLLLALNTRLRRIVVAAGYQMRGVYASYRGQPSNAQRWLLRSLAINPNEPTAYYALGQAFEENRQWFEAENAYSSAQQLRPKHSIYPYNRGWVLAKQENWYEAISAYDDAIALDLNYANAHYGRARALEEIGDANEAIRAYQFTNQLAPEFPWSHYYLGQLWEDQGDTQQAKREYQEAIKDDGQMAEAYHALGLLLWNNDEMVEAAAMLKRAQELYLTAGDISQSQALQQFLDHYLN